MTSDIDDIDNDYFIEADSVASDDEQINIDEILGGSLFESLLNEIRGGDESASDSAFIESSDNDSDSMDDDDDDDEDDDDDDDDDGEDNDESASDGEFINGGDDFLATTKSSTIIYEPGEDPFAVNIELKSSNVDEDEQAKLLSMEDDILKDSKSIGDDQENYRKDNVYTDDLIGGESDKVGSFSLLAQSIATQFLH
jgi:hypothetical protein